MRTAVVTGAASGMGQATAELLLAGGWSVLALDRTVAEIGSGPRKVKTLPVDVTRRADVRSAIREHVGGRQIDLVANVAGVYPPTTLETADEAAYRTIFDVNVLGVVNVIAESVPVMGDGGAIVNFASVDAFTVSAGQLLYGASKAAVVMLTKSLALELAPRRIRVNAIAPGWVNTPGNAATGRMAEAASSIPLGRVAEPDEIARWVLLLCEAQAGFLTGETIVLSGGDVIR